MKPIKLLMVLVAFAISAHAQTAAPAPTTEAFGKVSTADLEMKACDFEKDANAEVLFEKAHVYYDEAFNVVKDYHERIKIFKDNAKDAANIHIEFYGGNRSEFISVLQAESFNLVDGKVEVTKLDKKLLFLQHIDKNRDEYVFSMPAVK